MRYSIVNPVAQYRPQDFDLYSHTEPFAVKTKALQGKAGSVGKRSSSTLVTKLSDAYQKSLIDVAMRNVSQNNQETQTDEEVTQTDTRNDTQTNPPDEGNRMSPRQSWYMMPNLMYESSRGSRSDSSPSGEIPSQDYGDRFLDPSYSPGLTDVITPLDPPPKSIF